LIGLDVDYLTRAQLRVSKDRFEGELLRGQGLVVGRYDGRIAGTTADHNRGTPDFDPSYEAIAPAFTAAFGAYAKTELNWQTDLLYRPLAQDVIGGWNFHRDGYAAKLVAPSVIADLRDALHTNPNLRVFSGSGWYDLATPFYGTEYELANVALDPSVRSRISFGRYASGHMIYLSEDALRALRADLERFYQTALETAPR
jgi:carboxypeptidase C (cathepsin A)